MNKIDVGQPSFAAKVDAWMAYFAVEAAGAEARAESDETERPTEEVRDGE
jgi:hypothetical protein